MSFQMAVDGNMSLNDQRQTLHLQEVTKPCLLASLEKGQQLQNTATFNDLPLGQSVPDLILLEIIPPATLQSVQKDQQGAGRQLVFNSTVFVSGQDANVAGFR